MKLTNSSFVTSFVAIGGHLRMAHPVDLLRPRIPPQVEHEADVFET